MNQRLAMLVFLAAALLALFIYFGVHQAREKHSDNDESNPCRP